MTTTRFQKFSLFIAGVTAFCIGASILTIPRVFYGSYGIILADDPSLLSELRAPGAGLAVLGAIMLGGVLRSTFAPLGFVAALTVYLAFPVGRIVSLALDGVPSGSIMGALAVELVIACLCICAFAELILMTIRRGAKTENAF